MLGLALFVDVDAPAEVTWAAAVDWSSQGTWMLGTRVTPTVQGGQGEGGRLEAWTGFGPIGFLDPMEITLWQPPRACHVRHLGKIVRGTGAFEVEPRGDNASRFHWREDLELPFGPLGRVGWLLLRPLATFAVRLSLKRFATLVGGGSRTELERRRA